MTSVIKTALRNLCRVLGVAVVCPDSAELSSAVSFSVEPAINRFSCGIWSSRSRTPTLRKSVYGLLTLMALTITLAVFGVCADGNIPASITLPSPFYTAWVHRFWANLFVVIIYMMVEVDKGVFPTIREKIISAVQNSPSS